MAKYISTIDHGIISLNEVAGFFIEAEIDGDLDAKVKVEGARLIAESRDHLLKVRLFNGQHATVTVFDSSNVFSVDINYAPLPRDHIAHEFIQAMNDNANRNLDSNKAHLPYLLNQLLSQKEPIIIVEYHLANIRDGRKVDSLSSKNYRKILAEYNAEFYTEEDAA